MRNVKALVFDVFGTLVDGRSAIARDAETRLGRAGIAVDGPALADAWRAEHEPAMVEVRAGRRPFMKLDPLHRRNLDIVLPALGADAADEAARCALTQAWHRPDAWPDGVPGLQALRLHYRLALRAPTAISR
jgi:2-haloacid dehalogenase